MRICFIADATHPNTSRWASHLAGPLGHDVTILATKRAPERSNLGFSVRCTPAGGRLGYALLGWSLRAHLRDLRPDLVIAYRVQSNGLAAALTGFHPLVLAAQTETIVSPPDSRLYRAATRWAVARADLLQAWGRHMAERLAALGASPDKILVLPRGVETSTFSPPATRTTDPTYVVTRALRSVYRHDLLLVSFARLRERLRDARLVIAGDGPEREKLNGMVSKLDLGDSVRFTGGLDERSLARVLASSSIYVTLVAQEGVSASLLEAMAVGLVPVVPDLPGNREWVEEGANGRLIPFHALDDPDAIADLLEAAANDHVLRDRCFQVNPARIRRDADWTKNMATMDAKYTRLVERS